MQVFFSKFFYRLLWAAQNSAAGYSSHTCGVNVEYVLVWNTSLFNTCLEDESTAKYYFHLHICLQLVIQVENNYISPSLQNNCPLVISKTFYIIDKCQSPPYDIFLKSKRDITIMFIVFWSALKFHCDSGRILSTKSPRSQDKSSFRTFPMMSKREMPLLFLKTALSPFCSIEKCSNTAQ